MKLQTIQFKQTGAYIDVQLEAFQVDDHKWANDADLLDALQKLIQCAGSWSKFKLTITHDEPEEEE